MNADPLTKANSEQRQRLLAAAQDMARAVLAGEIAPVDGTTRIHDDVVEPLGHPAGLAQWCWLHAGYVSETSTDRSTAEELEEAIRAEAQRLADVSLVDLQLQIEARLIRLRLKRAYLHALQHLSAFIEKPQAVTSAWLKALFRGPEGMTQRRPDRIRRVLRWLSTLMMISAVVIWAATLFFVVPLAVLARKVQVFLHVVPLAAFAGHVLWSLGKRVGAATAVEAMAAAPDRPPVLYLRSFLADAEEQDKDDKKKVMFDLCDEQALKSVFEPAGPFVAIGKPGEVVPKFGAARAYIPTQDWQDAVRRLMETAAVVILRVGDTPGFLWEVDTALSHVPPERVLIYFSHQLNDRELRDAYRKLAGTINHRLSEPLPDTIDNERFVRFEDGWKPVVFGPLTQATRRRLWLAALSVAATHLRWQQRLSRSLRPFFIARGWLNAKRRLFSNGAILVALATGGPAIAGLMASRNFWCLKRPLVSLLTPALGIALSAGLLVAMAWCMPAVEAISTEFATGWPKMVLPITLWISLASYVIFVLTCWTLWTLLSGEAIRRHFAFGGAVISAWWWTLPVLLAAPLWWQQVASIIAPQLL